MKRLALGMTVMALACNDPFAPSDLREYIALAAGGEHTCAVDREGVAYCWGRGTDGQLGNNEVANRFTPAKVQTDVAFKDITAGAAHTCALAVDGQVWCWGFNAYYQMGNGQLVNPRVPHPIETNARFSAISAGAHHTCGLALDNRVFCWGHNRYGQNGNGLTVTTVPPEPVAGSLRASSISAGGYHTCAISTSGAALCWGRNDFAQLGTGTDVVMSALPVAVNTALRFTSIDAGATHTCAVSTAGKAYCWGSNEYGEIGDAAPFKIGLPGPATPTEALLLATVARVSAGTSHTCAVDSALGTVCWGRGTFGQLGNGNTLNHPVRQPVFIKPYDPLPFDVLATGGYTHACGINTGTVYCWGTGTAGQLGAGQSTFSVLPQRIRR